MSLLDQAKPLESIPGRTSFLFFGPGGSGKTSFAALHPGKRKLWIDVDDKLHELENITAEQKKTITQWRVDEPLGADAIQIVSVDPTRKNPYAGTKISERPRGYQKIVDITNELLTITYKAKKGQGEFPFDLVVLDSITRFMKHLEYLVMYQHNVSNMTQTLYGVSKRNAIEWLSGFLNLPCDRIIIAHDKNVEIKSGDEVIRTLRRPNITGTLAEEIVSYFTEAYYFQGRSGDGKWHIQTMTDRLIAARTSKKLEFEQELDAKKIYGLS